MTDNRRCYMLGKTLSYIYRTTNGDMELYKAVLKHIGFTKREIENDKWLIPGYCYD